MTGTSYASQGVVTQITATPKSGLVTTACKSRALASGSLQAPNFSRGLVTRLDPQRIESESSLMMSTIADILQKGCDSGIFQHVDLEKDVEIFASSIAYFFPIAGKEPHPLPQEEKLLAIVNWFIAQ
jgi:hypothetical protein